MAANPNEPLESILAIAERSLRANDLAERNLWLVEPSWTAGQAYAEMDAHNIDVAPVREEPLRRYVARSEMRERPTSEPAVSAAHPVDISHLVTGDMSLAEALALLPHRGFLFIIDGGRIAGIITASDVQRVPVTMVVLAMIFASEAGIDRLISETYRSEQDWMESLPAARLAGLEGRYSERRRRNAETTRLDVLMLEDRLALVRKRVELRRAVGFASRDRFDEWAHRLQRIRDDLAHGHTLLDVAHDPSDAVLIVPAVREFATRVWDAARKATLDGLP